MKKSSIVAKFGGTSLADACQFQKIKAIIEEDPDRRVIVASAPGKRFESDVKVTDLLLECYETAVSGGDPEQKLLEVRNRFAEIIARLELQFPLHDRILYDIPPRKSSGGYSVGPYSTGNHVR